VCRLHRFNLRPFRNVLGGDALSHHTLGGPAGFFLEVRAQYGFAAGRVADEAVAEVRR
jgi:hypothetical protein